MLSLGVDDVMVHMDIHFALWLPWTPVVGGD